MWQFWLLSSLEILIILLNSSNSPFVLRIIQNDDSPFKENVAEISVSNLLRELN